MKKVLTIIVLTIFALSPVALAQDHWLHLRVSEAEGAEKFNLNLPLATIAAMLPAMADEHLSGGEISLHSGKISVEDLRQMWNSLRGQGDFQIAEIQEDDMHLKVAMEGDYLIARSVEGSEKEVNVQIPAAVVDALLSGEGDELSLKAALDALSQLGPSQVVKASDGKKNIELWIDTSASN